MASSQILQKNGVTMDILETSNFRIMVNRTGAELISLARRDSTGNWRGFLYRDGETSAPASGWANHATVMGYFLHRLWKEQSVYRGSVIRGGNHGFLRHFVFDPPEVTERALVYRVPVSRIPPDAYPLKVSLELSYALSEDGLRVEFLFANEEPELDAHVSFGLHPGFAVSSVSDCKVLFPEGTYLRYRAPGNFLDGREEHIPFGGGRCPSTRRSSPIRTCLVCRRFPVEYLCLRTRISAIGSCSTFQKFRFLLSGPTWRPIFVSSPVGDCRTAIPPGLLNKRSAFKPFPQAHHCGVVLGLIPAFCHEDLAFCRFAAGFACGLHLWICCSLRAWSGEVL